MIISLVLAKGKDDETIVLYLSVGVVIGGIMQLLVHLFALKKLKLLRYFGVGITALKKGKKADIVVFDGNLFETAIEEIRSRKVEVTFLNGRIVYSHE